MLFAYPKSRHVRTEKPRAYLRYQAYKSTLQREFAHRCVYCQMPDTMRQYREYGVDHYRPKKRFPNLSAEYTNLFYCCNACNQLKGDYWPAPRLLSTHFIPNPCSHEMYKHLRYTETAVVPMSQAGIVAEEMLDLNEDEIVGFRKFMLEVHTTATKERSELEATRSQIAEGIARGSVPQAAGQVAISKIDSRLAANALALARLEGRV